MSKLICFLTCLTMAIAADLSPAKWPAADKAQAESREQTVFPPNAQAIEGHALVTATLSPIALRAGIEALKQGGTAADAAATIALTQITTALGSYVSYAGILQLVYYDSHTQKLYSLDAGWNSYLDETKPATIPMNDAAPGAEGRKTLVPGFMAGIEAMHKRFGRLPFKSLFQPAIWYAENGITVLAAAGELLSHAAASRAHARRPALPAPGRCRSHTQIGRPFHPGRLGAHVALRGAARRRLHVYRRVGPRFRRRRAP